MRSIIQIEKECFICKSPYVEEHHIYGGANRKNSEKYGLKVWLCHRHHNEPPDGVHFNKALMDYLHRYGQVKFEETQGTRDFFMQIFGKNYL
jgi:hypothetical protein